MDENKSWKYLLENYIIENQVKIPKDDERERKVARLFLNIISEDSKNEIIPKFFYKKPEYNELYYSIKAEAKQRFLIVKTYEVPQKRRKYYLYRPKRTMARIKK